MAIRPLKARDRGFASFEKYLIDHQHIGWIHKLSSSIFVLKKSQFTNIKTSHAYEIPEGMHVPDGTFVQVEIREKNPKHILDNNSIINCYLVSEIHKIRLIDLEIPKPYLYGNDFVHEYLCIKDEFRGGNEFVNRIASYWKNADADGLDWSLAVQLLSCPKWLYGVGGIGAVSTSFAGTRETPFKDIKSCIDQLMPRDFRSDNKFLKYNYIENKNNFQDVEIDRSSGKIPEVSYNYMNYFPQRDVPIQLPIFIENAEYRGRIKDEDPDITDYILTSLMISPPENVKMAKQIENTIIKVREKFCQDRDLSWSMDAYSPIKIALALCRMNLKEELDEDMLSKSMSKFSEVYEKYMDAEDFLLKINPGRETRVIPRARGPIKDPILSQETRILKIIIEISEDYGLEWVHISKIRAHKRFNQKWNDTLIYSLQILNNSGLVLMKNNYTEFRPIKSD
jgi:hypothetical protein